MTHGKTGSIPAQRPKTPPATSPVQKPVRTTPRPLANDLYARLSRAHEAETCVVPRSQADGRRLRRAKDRGLLLSPAPGVYVLPDPWNQLDRLEQERRKLLALAQLHHEWVFASYSAAVLLGLDVSYRLLGPIHVACDRKAHSRSSPSIRRHVFRDVPVLWTGNAYVTPLERTVFDCTRAAPFPLALGIADSALRTYGSPKEHFSSAFMRIDGRNPNRWRALEVMDLANDLAENGGESFARAVMIREGYMPPELQVEVVDPVEPGSTYRVDFYWRLHNGDVAGELDGRDKYVRPVMTGGRDAVDVLRDERLRESHLTGANAKIMRFSFADVQNTAKFRRLLNCFGIPSGYPVPRVALT